MSFSQNTVVKIALFYLILNILFSVTFLLGITLSSFLDTAIYGIAYPLYMLWLFKNIKSVNLKVIKITYWVLIVRIVLSAAQRIFRISEQLNIGNVNFPYWISGIGFFLVTAIFLIYLKKQIDIRKS